MTLAAFAAVAVALALGPLRLALRAGLRMLGGRSAVARWQRAATLGLGAGLLAAPVLTGVVLGGEAAVRATVLGLVLLLAAQDLAWRWLPYEWTLPLLALGLIDGFLSGNPSEALFGAALGGGLLLALWLTFRLWRGVEALGVGDIWLAAGLGCFSGPATIPWVLALAALLGLASESLKKFGAGGHSRKRWGVAYGAHCSVVFLIVLAF